MPSGTLSCAVSPGIALIFKIGVTGAPSFHIRTSYSNEAVACREFGSEFGKMPSDVKLFEGVSCLGVACASTVATKPTLTVNSTPITVDNLSMIMALNVFVTRVETEAETTRPVVPLEMNWAAVLAVDSISEAGTAARVDLAALAAPSAPKEPETPRRVSLARSLCRPRACRLLTVPSGHPSRCAASW